MSFYTRILDKLVLCPSRQSVDCGSQVRHEIVYGGNQKLEVYIHRADQPDGHQPDAFLLKFPGTGGRAERSTVHPSEFWSDEKVEVWTINPPGYGGSTGRASLHNIDRMIEALQEELRFRGDGQPLILGSNSLGSLAAFRFATRYPVAGMVVRNPVPLREIVQSRKRKWHPTWLMNKVVSRVPDDLDTIANANLINVPALFIQSAEDTVIPTCFQDQIIDVFAGEKQLFVIPDGEHHDLPQTKDLPEYREKLQWLWRAAVRSADETDKDQVFP